MQSRPVPSATVLADEIRIHQSVVIHRNLPVLILGKASAVAAVFSLDFGATVRSGAIYALLLQLALLIPMLRSYLQMRGQSRPKRVDKQRIRRMQLYAGVMGVVWATAVLLVFGAVGQINAVIVLMITFFLGFGAVALTPPLPLASIAYLLPLAVGVAFSGIRHDTIDAELLILIGVPTSIMLAITATRNWQETKASAYSALQRLRIDDAYHRSAIEVAQQEADQQKQVAQTLSHLIGGLPFPFVIIQGNRVVEANSRAFEQFALTPDKLNEVSITDFFVDLDDQIEIVSKLEKEGRISEYEVQMKDYNGNTFWAVLSNNPLHYQGVESHVFAIYVIDARKRAEAALQESERRMHAMLEGSPIAAQIQRHDGSYRYANNRTAELAGMSTEAFLRTHGIDHFVDPAQAEVVGEMLRRDGHVRGFKAQLKKQDGTPYWALLSYEPATDDPETDYFSWIYDITEHEEIEAELRKAREAADQANEAKSEFLSNMSHEIRTPMAAIIGLAELCLRTSLSHKQRDYVANVHSSATLLLGILNDILDFSKIEAGKLQLEHTPFSLEQVLENVVTVASVGARGKDLELLIARSAEVPEHLIGDPLRLSQVLINLVSNAIKFTDRGEVIVSANLQAADKTGALVTFLVSDTGRGMSAAQQEELFQAFKQADASISRRYGGTGLGLPISRNLVRLMGGELSVASELGQGSTFSFTVRFDIDEGAGSRLTFPPETVPPLHMLVVNNNEAARAILCDQLADLGIKTITAASGAEALERLKAAPEIDAVLLDAALPDLTGFEVARRIANHDGAFPKIIMTSMLDSQDMMPRAGSEYVAAFLAKPITLSRLTQVITETFGPAIDPAGDADGDEQKKVEGLSRIRGARILLVEDNELNQQVARELLENQGFHVDVAGNGEEALGCLQIGDYDCVLMDMQMPVMGGFETVKRIRENPRHRSLPIIAMTANAMVSDKPQAKQLGMNDHIAKPITPAILFSTLVNWIEPRQRCSSRITIDECNDEDGSTWPELPGIDATAGLLHLNHDGARYRALLMKFAADQATAMADLRQAVASDEYEEAARLAHTLCGLAGTIGAKQLADYAMRIEAALSHGDPPVATLLDSAARELAAIIDAIRTVKWPSNGAMHHVDCTTRDDFDRLVGQLEKRLEAFDPRANELFETALHASKAHGLGDVFAAMAPTIGSYDFETALRLLRTTVAERAIEGDSQ